MCCFSVQSTTGWGGRVLAIFILLSALSHEHTHSDIYTQNSTGTRSILPSLI